jgi:hypothetical protein
MLIVARAARGGGRHPRREALGALDRGHLRLRSHRGRDHVPLGLRLDRDLLLGLDAMVLGSLAILMEERPRPDRTTLHA